MPSIVVGRKATARGREQYCIRTIELGEHRFHWMLGDVLVPMTGGEAECNGCRCIKVCPLRQAAS
ncbi:hypothetical protein U8C35_04230 [Sinorhizobium medicae]|uniref:hypothetical protein n=1 Tax=Sinorhizobium medicae TaxID=110321 RepID=UPI002AF6BF99|nr:hypothetical protein [Sinorhizobium medicae]WQO59668.1 hypothetical protein U8C35_04230 [Sinorhizobium medicae]